MKEQNDKEDKEDIMKTTKKNRIKRSEDSQ